MSTNAIAREEQPLAAVSAEPRATLEVAGGLGGTRASTNRSSSSRGPARAVRPVPPGATLPGIEAMNARVSPRHEANATPSGWRRPGSPLEGHRAREVAYVQHGCGRGSASPGRSRRTLADAPSGGFGRDAVVPAHIHSRPLDLRAELEVSAAARTSLSDGGVLRCASQPDRPRMHGPATRQSA
jgi:hypothetical protein